VLLVGVVGEGAARGAMLRRLACLGVRRVEAAADLAWDADRPAIVAVDGGEAGSFDCAALPQLVIGACGAASSVATADVWATAAGADSLFASRLVPFERNLRTGQRAPRRQAAVLVGPDPAWPGQAARLIERLQAAAGAAALRIDHVGSTSVAGLPAKDVVDIQIVVDSLASARGVADAARRAGFVRPQGAWFGEDRFGRHYPEEVAVDADPGRPANVNVRPADAPVWRDVLRLRDWLRAHEAERDAYLALKRSLAGRPDNHVDRYGTDKMPWIRAALARAAEAGA